MKALILKRPGEFFYEEREMPGFGAKDVLVKISAVCICGSDIHAVQGKMPLFRFPRVIGHEVTGTVEEIGKNVTRLKKGDKVCLMPCISCGTCAACSMGCQNACPDLNLYGVQKDGGLCEYMSAPEENWIRADQKMSDAEAAMVEPLTIGAHAVGKLRLKPGEKVLVLGAGPIGVSCAVNAGTYGARAVLADISETRLKFVEQTFQYPTFHIQAGLSGEEQEKNLLRCAGLKQGFDAVIDTTANTHSMESAWRYIRHGGRIVFLGISQNKLEIDGMGFHMKEPSLFVSRNSNVEDYRRVIGFCSLGMIEPSRFITHRAVFSEAGSRILEWCNAGSGVFKAVVTFP